MIMDEIANFKKTQINNYFHSLYDLNEDNLNIQQIKMDLQQLIGEIPGIDLHYETEKLIAEDGGDEVKIEKLSGITIFYSYVYAPPLFFLCSSNLLLTSVVMPV